MPANTKPTGKALTEAQDEALNLLLDAYPDGFTRSEAVERIGHTALTRFGELRRFGWDIPIGERRGKQAFYRLRSKARMEADPTHAGCIIREGGRTGWTARTHQEAACGPYTEEALREAEADALAAYRARLAREVVHLAVPVRSEEPEEFMTFGFEEYASNATEPAEDYGDEPTWHDYDDEDTDDDE
jgi:hypothetical protein